MPDPCYPVHPPFHPPRAHPEYPFDDTVLDTGNAVYDTVRRALADLGLDPGRVDTPAWNPLGCWVGEESTVLIKPNLVLGSHPRGGDLDGLITHASVLRPLLDYVWIASRGKATVVVGDSPLQGTVFADAVRHSGLDALVAWFREEKGMAISLVDFRRVVAEFDDRNHVKVWREQPGDPAGYATFDLGKASMLDPLAKQSHAFRISNYDVKETLAFHNPTSHRYVVAKSVLKADLIINVPKLKTHCKAGVTLGMKNFVGTIGRKECLAHHRYGGDREDGDEYPESHVLKRVSERLERMVDVNRNHAARSLLKFMYRVRERLIKVLGLDPVRDGGWHGNDTVWRMVVDIVRIACYGNRAVEAMEAGKQRHILTVIDGIVAGENEGPLEATPRRSGIIVAGANPLLTDIAAVGIMGFDHRKIPLLRESLAVTEWPIADGDIAGLRTRWDGKEWAAVDGPPVGRSLDFAPAIGWRGQIEHDERVPVA